MEKLDLQCHFIDIFTLEIPQDVHRFRLCFGIFLCIYFIFSCFYYCLEVHNSKNNLSVAC